MAETLASNETFAILTERERSTASIRVLKHDDTVPSPSSEHGLYHAGTRFLSRLVLLVGGAQPLLLSSTISDDNAVFTADLTNPDVIEDRRVVLPRGALHLFRSRVLWLGSLMERVRISNYGLAPVALPIAVTFDADFADIFEVRGTRRAARGRRHGNATGEPLVFRYSGLDGIERSTHVRATVTPDSREPGLLRFTVRLAPHEALDVEMAIECEPHAKARMPGSFGDIVARMRRPDDQDTADGASPIVSSSPPFNRWIQRSAADLRMLLTETPHGPYPYAGIPWFSTPFGRDGIITALELLWAYPDVAKGVLAFLAATQATATDASRDAEPGKILHEMRDGEMAALGEIPFGRYYGSADATPLFVMLAHAYFDRTGDLPFVERLWPHVTRALEWMESYGDRDGDGFIEYARRSDCGLVQQGWKDSWDSVFHADGTLAPPPIALCEIQAYAYAAWRGAARLAAVRGQDALAARWDDRAAALQQRFDDAFWCEELGTYALALDAAKVPCRVQTSNAGHCLFTGIARETRAARVAGTLLEQHSFGGWGVRTVAAGAARYNPMSYHNGSVWPHDNAVAAAGLARYGLMGAASQIFSAMFDLSQAVDLHRLPELICGFHRRARESPTLYPVACAPQAWAAGAVYLLLQACLGLRVEAEPRRVSLTRALLPEPIEWVRLRDLSVGGSQVDVLISRNANDVGVSVLRRHGQVEVLSIK
jgi:glycogen debranching enzyme